MFLTPYPKRKSRQTGFVKPLQALEGTTSPIQHTLRTAKLFTNIQQSLKEFLNHNIGPHCHIIKLNNEQLELAVPNTAVASKLRQSAPSIAKHLSQHGYAIKHINVKVRALLQENQTSQNTPVNKQVPTLTQCHNAYQTLLEQYPEGPLADTLRKILQKKVL